VRRAHMCRAIPLCGAKTPSSVGPEPAGLRCRDGRTRQAVLGCFGAARGPGALRKPLLASLGGSGIRAGCPAAAAGRTSGRWSASGAAR